MSISRILSPVTQSQRTSLRPANGTQTCVLSTAPAFPLPTSGIPRNAAARKRSGPAGPPHPQHPARAQPPAPSPRMPAAVLPFGSGFREHCLIAITPWFLPALSNSFAHSRPFSLDDFVSLALELLVDGR